MRVEHFLAASARRHPDKTALVVGEARVSFGELDATANRLAHALRARGVRRGDRVAVFLDNSAEAVAALFAALKAGGAFCVVNPTTKGDKLAFMLNNCRASAVVTSARLLPVAAPAVEQAPSVVATVVAGAEGEPAARGGASWDGALAGMPADAPPDPGIDIDLAMVIYTSGSTGFPKGVMMTHQNIDFAAASITTYLENTPDDVILSVLPLAFDYGLYQVLMAAKLGMTVVLEQSFAFPAVVLQKLEKERATGFPLVPTIAALLLKMRDLAPGRFPHLRYISNTAAALPPAHIQKLQELFPATRIFSMYGLTECKRCTYLPPEQLKVRPGSVGKAIPGTEAYVAGDDGKPLPAGQVGELVIRGGHVMKGYWENAEATDRVLKAGPYAWEKVLHTGDLFKADDEGFLYFVGRKDDIIKSRGEKVSPKEVENVLYALPGVREAAVVGVPDPVLGMALKAVIAPVEEGALGAKEVIAHCAKHLEDFMVPRLVEFRKELPKTDTGKIRRSEVQAEELRRAGAEPAAGTGGGEE
jgi:amino acid adenylation domain-containing protein